MLKEILRKNMLARRGMHLARASKNYIIDLDRSALARLADVNFSDIDKYIYLHWRTGRNFGDDVSRELTAVLSDRRPVLASDVPNLTWRNVYSCVGSVLQFPSVTLTDVWGSGFIYAKGRFLFKPKRVHAVRGRLTRDIVVSQGLECPKVYGDPAVLLFDTMSNSRRSGEFKIGVIPHYADVGHPELKRLARRDDVHLIDVLQNWSTVALEALRCETIISSSLHGIILADALNIPNRWLGVSELVMKGGFKFKDYFSSVGRDEDPLGVDDMDYNVIRREAHLRHLPFSREALLSSCPFLSSGFEERLKNMVLDKD